MAMMTTIPPSDVDLLMRVVGVIVVLALLVWALRAPPE